VGFLRSTGIGGRSVPTQPYKTKDGKRVPGVTTVLSMLGFNKRQLMIWANKEGFEGRDINQRADEAATVGTIAHEMVEMDLKHLPFDATKYPPELVAKAENAYLAWLEWKDFFEFTDTQSELALVSEAHGFGGTIDIAAVKKVKSIIDLKTSNGTYEDHLIQIAAYGGLYNECYPDDPIRAYYILRLGKEDGSFHYHYYPDLSLCWDTFLHALAIYKAKSVISKML
jgi:hypothetical protein